MTLRYPDIFPKFRCVGSACEDNCCRIGWDIEIDEDTLSYYKGLDSDLGRRLCESIYEEEGCYYMSQPHGCPFLNEEGLCGVQLECGGEHISEICREHPRFYEWFGDYKEAGLGLCCEEASRLLMEHERPLLFTEKQTDEPADELGFSPELLRAVRSVRDRLIDIGQDRGFDISQRLGLLTYCVEDIQEAVFDMDCERLKKLSGMLAIDGFRMEIVAQARQDRHMPREEAYSLLCEIFGRMEYMGSLGERFRLAPEEIGKLISAEESFAKSYAPFEHELENISVYLIYRYFIKCVRDLAVTERLFCVLLCVLAVRFLFLGEFAEKGELPDKERRIRLVKDFSKEVEYDSGNMDIIYEEAQEGRLCPDMLCGMIF